MSDEMAREIVGMLTTEEKQALSRMLEKIVERREADGKTEVCQAQGLDV